MARIGDTQFLRKLVELLQIKDPVNLPLQLDPTQVGVTIAIPAELLLSRARGVQELADLIIDAPANPAAGANYTRDIPAGEAWQLQSVAFRHVSSGVAAQRVLLISAHLTTDSNQVLWRTLHNQASSAGITSDFAAGKGTGIAFSNLDRVFPLPLDLWTPAGYTLFIGSREVQVGDQLSRIRFQYRKALIPST